MMKILQKGGAEALSVKQTYFPEVNDENSTL